MFWNTKKQKLDYFDSVEEQEKKSFKTSERVKPSIDIKSKGILSLFLNYHKRFLNY